MRIRWYFYLQACKFKYKLLYFSLVRGLSGKFPTLLLQPKWRLFFPLRNSFDEKKLSLAMTCSFFTIDPDVGLEPSRDEVNTGPNPRGGVHQVTIHYALPPPHPKLEVKLIQSRRVMNSTNAWFQWRLRRYEWLEAIWGQRMRVGLLFK